MKSRKPERIEFSAEFSADLPDQPKAPPAGPSIQTSGIGYADGILTGKQTRSEFIDECLKAREYSRTVSGMVTVVSAQSVVYLSK